MRVQEVWRIFIAIVLCWSLFAVSSPIQAWQASRLQAGVDLFPSFLAADTKIHDKIDADGMLSLVVLHRGASTQAQDIAHQLEKVGTIRNIPIRVFITDDPNLSEYKQKPPAGVFLSEKRLNDLDTIIAWGKRSHRTVFSPFEGDVESGLFCGLSVREKVLPLVNQHALDTWGIVLKRFFLRITRRYAHE
ncbi:MAG: hypothetical protein HQL54_11905 [Magnetococcales bacterium]|nr:hypothetical protein [Magnetococcales bacterium]